MKLYLTKHDYQEIATIEWKLGRKSVAMGMFESIAEDQYRLKKRLINYIESRHVNN